MTKIGDAKRKLHGMITGSPDNFSWLIENKLAGSAIPTSKDEIKWLQEQGVKSIVTVREETLDENWVEKMKYLHVHSNDMGVPEFDDLVNAVDFIHQRITQDEPVMVHCLAGLGRTGTILACYLIKYDSMSADDAIQKVREKRQGSIQSFSQEELIHRFQTFVAYNYSGIDSETSFPSTTLIFKNLSSLKTNVSPPSSSGSFTSTKSCILIPSNFAIFFTPE